MSTAPVETQTAPGLHPGISFEEYHAIRAVSHSLLEPFRRTPAHAREAMLHPAESKEKTLGQAFHVFLLEEAKFHSHYAVPPKVDRRFKEGKATWAAFESAHPTKNLVAADEVEQYQRMRDSIMGHPVASELISKAVAKELSFVWNEAVEQEDGKEINVLCKGREDILTPYGGYVWIVNLKTTKDASERSFGRDIASYGYHRGSAWYRRGLAAATTRAERRVAYIAVEKEPPYCVAVHELDERALDQGEREMLRFLSQYLKCTETGVWPGYDPGLSLLDLPPWAVDSLDR